MNLYLKIFLFTSIPYGIVMGIFSHSMILGLISGLSFGILMTLIIGFLHSRSVKRMPYGTSKETIGVRHIRYLELNLPYNKTFELCLQSLNLIKGSRIKTEDQSNGMINARAGITWKTWGDVISFKVNKIDDNRTHIEVSSKPLVPTTIIDYGKNLENVEKISSFIKSHLNQSISNQVKRSEQVGDGQRRNARVRGG